MAEGVGVEPTVRLPVRLISSQVPSTTQPPFPPAGLNGYSFQRVEQMIIGSRNKGQSLGPLSIGPKPIPTQLVAGPGPVETSLRTQGSPNSVVMQGRLPISLREAGYDTSRGPCID